MPMSYRAKDKGVMTTWAANEQRAMQYFKSLKSSPKLKKPVLIESCKFYLPDPNFLNHHQAKEFITEMKKHNVTLADVMLYEHCTNITKRKVALFHYNLNAKSVLLSTDFQAEILGITRKEVESRYRKVMNNGLAK